ncbi:hypothetical protein BDA96_01G513200 [Sorghum bicolor]|uniref:Uncharacterized protein n=2 Tax=Sorghum bicolor TaxID=4558 RepID=A0A921S5Q6_SORBI|nr:hypothetical protein BDA96_01G513200 [Sorghum bicolor]KXG40038.1 hypothetical protein SORBI_3001G481500 [Sorghum bicolor]
MLCSASSDNELTTQQILQKKPCCCLFQALLPRDGRSIGGVSGSAVTEPSKISCRGYNPKLEGNLLTVARIFFLCMYGQVAEKLNH